MNNNKVITKSEQRKIVYEDRRSLDDFGCNDEGSLNHIIYTKWLRYRTEIDAFKESQTPCYLKVFNDAYYICTLSLLLPYGKNIIPKNILEYVERPSVVFPLVYLYLSMLTTRTSGIDGFMIELEKKNKIEQDWGRNYDELVDAVAGFEHSIDPCQFAQRTLSPELLSTIKWEQLTDSFKNKQIEEMVRNFARNRNDWQMMLDAIKAAAQQYDYDFGFEDYEQEVIDEDGPHLETVKVPIDLYDDDGNSLLEPLKRRGVYQLCDDLKEKFDELVLKTYPPIDSSSPNIVTEPLNDQENSNEQGNPFKHNNNPFLWDKVKSALENSCVHDADYALLEITLYHHGQLYTRNSHTAFLRELVKRGLIPRICNAEDPKVEFRKVVQSIRNKVKNLPKDGYRAWTQKPKDKRKCEEIGSILDDSMPYRG